MCEHKNCCYNFCCKKGEDGGVKAIKLANQHWREADDFSFELAIKLSSDIAGSRIGSCRTKEMIDDCIRQEDIIGVLAFIHKEQQVNPFGSPCCVL